MLPDGKDGYVPQAASAVPTNQSGIAVAVPLPSESDVKVEVVPGSVLQALPTVIPEAQILSSYAQQGFDVGKITNDAEYHNVVAAVEIPPQGYYFSPNELNVLNAQPPPATIDYSVIANAPPPPSSSGSQQVVLQPGDGAMPIIPGAYSSAIIHSDTLKSGIRSRDPVLSSREEILRFLNMHNTTPLMLVHVEGYHHTTTTDSNGNTTTRRVTDFDYRLDVSRFIYPYGKITVSSQSNLTVEQMIDNYLEDTNSLRSLQMKKKVYWNTNALVYLVRSYIRALGWGRELTVHVEFKNHSVRICDDNVGARMYDNCLGRTCMVITIIPALIFCFYGSGHRERGLRSIFVIPFAPIQVFDSIRPQLWVPYGSVCTLS